MRYRDAMVMAIRAPWFYYIKRDSVCGHGFEILLYGIKLILSYIALFLLRALVAILFPLSAFLIMYINKKNIEHQKAAMKDWLHR